MEKKVVDHPVAKGLNHGRRTLTQWYTRAFLLAEFGLLRPKTLQTFKDLDEVHKFVELVEPLDAFQRTFSKREPNAVFNFLRLLSSPSRARRHSVVKQKSEPLATHPAWQRTVSAARSTFFAVKQR